MSDTVWRPLQAHGVRPEGFGGVMLRPDDPAYEGARVVFNAMIDKRPAVIAQCESAADVAAAVRFGVAEGLEIAVRGAGHSVAGTGVSDGGLVIDLRKMRSVQLDPDARIVRVGGGATWGDLDGACWPYALATTGGRVSTTGVAGLTLGGGSGWLERKFGLACDSLVSVELVTATGELVIADDTRNRELFWALHGGGGNFGVATALTLRVRPLPGMAFGRLFWPADAGPAVMRAYRDLFKGGAPEELGGSVFYSAAPLRDYVPPWLQGRPAVGVTATYTGSEAQLRSALAPVIDLAPEGMMLAELPYAEIQSALDDPPGLRNYWSAEHLESWPDEAVDVFSARATEMPSPATSQQLVCPWGGAVARYADRWPLPHRQAPWVVQSYGVWADPAEDATGIDWARNVCTDLKPYSTGSVYLNFIGDEGPDRVKAAFGDHFDRLARVKAEFDPGNVFHLNHNIKPA